MKALYKTPEELESACNAYFAKCERKPCLDKRGRVFNANPKRPNVEGLAYSLGFASRQSIYDIEKRSPDFANVIARAKLQIQEHLAEGLEFRDSCAGCKFMLARYYGWKPAQDDPATDRQIIVQIETKRGNTART